MNEARKPFWDQYTMLVRELNKTVNILRSMGVTDFPGAESVTAGIPWPPQETRQKVIQGIPEKPRGSTFGLSGAIREASQEIRRGITGDVIADWIAKKYPTQEINHKSLRALVSAIAKEDGWVITEKGAGGKQAKYDINALSL